MPLATKQLREKEGPAQMWFSRVDEVYVNKHICPEYDKGETKGNRTTVHQFWYLSSLYILSTMLLSFIVFI